MLTLSKVQEVLKTTYGQALSNQLNTSASVLLANIEAVPVSSKDFEVAAPFGINGGVGFSRDSDTLPATGGQMYSKFKSTVKSVYAPIQFSDLAWKASQNNAGAFLDIAKKEFEGAETALKFNLGRSVYGDGSGKIAEIAAVTNANEITVTSGLNNLVEGLIVDFYAADTTTAAVSGRRITSVNRPAGKVTVDGAPLSCAAGFLTVQKSFGNELTGLGAIFDDSVSSIYGVDKAANGWVKPTVVDAANDLDDDIIFDTLASLQQHKGSDIDMIIAGTGAYRSYASYLRSIKKSDEANIELKGGFMGISYTFDNKKIPIVMDKFADNDSMYLLETSKLKLYGIGGWDWIEYGDGSIVQRLTDRPVYQAVMARYCDLLCEHPGGMGKIKNCMPSA